MSIIGHIYRKIRAFRRRGGVPGAFLILGPARAGKSTFAKMLADKFGFDYVDEDEIDARLVKFLPAFNHKSPVSGNGGGDVFDEFVIPYLKLQIAQSTKPVVFDSHMSLSKARKRLPPTAEIIAFGFPDTTPEEKLATTRQYEDNDWTAKMSDSQLLQQFARTIKRSKVYRKKARKYGYRFIDTEHNRKEIFAKLLDELEAEYGLEK